VAHRHLVSPRHCQPLLRQPHCPEPIRQDGSDVKNNSMPMHVLHTVRPSQQVLRCTWVYSVFLMLAW